MQKKLEELFGDPVIVSMFGKFYEEFLEPYLDEFEGYTLLKDEKGKPVVWFDESTLEGIRKSVDDIISETRLEELRGTVEDIENRFGKSKGRRAKCTPDGIVVKNDKYYLWEAKCEPRSIQQRAPWGKMRSRIKDFDWFLAERAQVNISGQKQKKTISGYILFWWVRPEEENELQEHEDTVEKLKLAAEKRNKSFEVKYIKEILDKLIKEKPKWYIDIINKQQEKVNKFFNLLKATT